MVAWMTVLLSTRQVVIVAATAAANGFPRDVVEDEDLHFDINSSKPQIRHYGKIHAGTVMAKVTKFQSHSDNQENENIQKRLVAYDLDPILPPYDNVNVYEHLMVKLPIEVEAQDEDEDQGDTAIIEGIEEDDTRQSSLEGDQIDTASSEKLEEDIGQVEESIAANAETSIDEVEVEIITGTQDPTEIQAGDQSLEVEANEAIDTEINDLAEDSIRDESKGDAAPGIEEGSNNALFEEVIAAEEDIVASLELQPIGTSESEATDVIQNEESHANEQAEQIEEKRRSEESPEDYISEMEERVEVSIDSSDETVIIDGNSIDVEEKKEENVASVDTVIENDAGSDESTDKSFAEVSSVDQNQDEVESMHDPVTIIPELDANDSEDPSSLAFDDANTAKSIVEDEDISDIIPTKNIPQEEGVLTSTEDEDDIGAVEIGDETIDGTNKEEHENIVAEQEKVASERTVYLEERIVAKDLIIQNSDAESIVSNEENQEAEGLNDKTHTDVDADEVDTVNDTADSIDGEEIDNFQAEGHVDAEEDNAEITSASDVVKSEEEITDIDAEQVKESGSIVDETDDSVTIRAGEQEIDTIEAQPETSEVPGGQEYSNDIDEAIIPENINAEFSVSAVDTDNEEPTKEALSDEVYNSPENLDPEISQVELPEEAETTEEKPATFEVNGDHEYNNDNDVNSDNGDLAIPEISDAEISVAATDIDKEEPTNEAISEEVFETLERLDSEREQVEVLENSQSVSEASIDASAEDTAIIEEVDQVNDKKLREEEPQQMPVIPKPTANDEFVRGLDDLHKFLEEVDPPDELDVGASGLSMEDVFKQQGVTIIKIRVEKGVAQIKKSLKTLKKNGHKQWNNFKEALDDNFDINVEEMALSVVERLEGPYQNVKEVFSNNRGKLDGVGKVAEKILSKAKTILSRIGIFDSDDDDYDYDDEDDDLQINDNDLAEMRKKLMERYS